MRCFLYVICLISVFKVPVNALTFDAPSVPQSGKEYMPDTTNDFAEGLMEIFSNIIDEINPGIKESVSHCAGLIAIVILISTIQLIHSSAKVTTEYAGVIAVAATLFFHTNTMIQLSGKTISELSDYGKLLFPVMTAALAAQGGISSSTAIYIGASSFSSVLSMLVSSIFLPLVYLFLGLSVANGAIGDEILKSMRDLLKQLIGWSLKILLTVFTTYIGITGAVSGATDAAALKATKVTISSFVPVVGGILSDASEAILVSISMAKNAAGIYGIFAIFAVFLKPFLQIGTHYLLLKATCGICGIFGAKRTCALIGDFSTAMGLLLAMTGTNCILLLISTICFMKGVG